MGAAKPFTIALWQEAVDAFRAHGGKPSYYQVARLIGRDYYTVKRMWELGYPPSYEPIKDIIAREAAESKKAVDPAPAQGVTPYSNVNEASHNRSTQGVSSISGTNTAGVAAAPVVPTAQVAVLPPSVDVDELAARVTQKALGARPQMVSAEIDSLVMGHDINRRILAKLVLIFKALEPNIDKMSERMIAKAGIVNSATGEVGMSTERVMRWIGGLAKHLKTISDLQGKLIEQTHLVYGQPTQITETRSGSAKRQDPDAMLAQLAEMHARMTAQRDVETVAAFEAGGDGDGGLEDDDEKEGD